ncbi:YfhO family protein [Zongyangia hominis]|uniref:YfhO family protein n=1 Tax=Zongyangia hominis TaxID=2763677 RepID=A0A926EDI9_9FIRM|nr:YfhO family protein [Zongyangia hominis]MBC8570219.1 YfhO family protein [Zongyangia hominis]
MQHHKLKNPLQDKGHFAAAFLIPILVMWTVYALFNVFPFGQNSLLVLDLNGQYVYYFEHMRDALLGGDGLLYSWTRSLGGEMLGLYSYYLASPFSFLTLLFPKAMITEAILAMTLLKIGSCGLAMAIYLDRGKKTSRISTLLFSFLYATMAYVVAEANNIMWLDGLIALPLIIWGIEKLCEKRKFALFIIPLALCFLANYYIGYMVGIFSFLYFLYYVFSREEGPSFRRFLGKLGWFLLCAAIAAAIAAIILLPTMYSLRLGKLNFSDPNFSPLSQFDFFQFFSKLLPSSYDTLRPEGLPMIYCGVLTLLLLPLYFLNKKISLRRRLLSAGILAVMFISMNVRTIDLVWHGFAVPNWLNYRYSFMFCFLLLVFACEAFERIREVSFASLIKCYAGLLFLVALVDHFAFEYISPENSIWLAVICATIYVGMLALQHKDKAENIVPAVLAFTVFMEMGASAWNTIKAQDKDIVYSTRTSYREFMDPLQPVVDKLKAMDTSFYRSEKNFTRMVNDNMALGLYGMSHSSSSLNEKNITMIERLGVSARGHWTKYLGATEVVDALFGIKYVMDKGTIDKPYSLVLEENGIGVYENPNALPIVFPSNAAVKGVSVDNDNPFELQNELLSALVGGEYREFFHPAQIENTDLVNVKEEQAEDHIKYSPLTEGVTAQVDYTVQGAIDGELYCYFPSNYERKVNLWVNDAWLDTFFDNETYHVMKMGEFTAGERVKLTMTLTESEVYLKNAYFYTFDRALFQQAMDELKARNAAVEKKSETKLTATVEAAEDMVLYTSIPYEDGWTIKVDGKKVETYRVLDALLACDLPAGTHQITLTFLPKEVVIGAVVSLAGVAALVLLILWSKKHPERTETAGPADDNRPLKSAPLRELLQEALDETPDSPEEEKKNQ